MPSRRRYVVMGVLALAAIVGMAVAHGVQWGLGQAGLGNPHLGGLRELTVANLTGYGLALITGIGLLRYTPSRTLATEVVDELARVSWPSQRETGHATLVVIAAVVLSSAFLGIFDAMWMWVTDLILGART